MPGGARLTSWLFPINFLFLCFSLTVNAADTQVLKIGGTGSAMATLRLLINDFNRQNKDIRVEIPPSLGTQGGMLALQDGAIDLAIVGQPIQLQGQQSDIIYRSYAKTAIAFVADPNTPVKTLSEHELADIFTGNTGNWPNGTFIRLVMRSLTESDFVPVIEYSQVLREALTAASRRKDIVTSATVQENARILLTLPGSFGISSLAQIRSEHLALKIIAYEDVQPTLYNLQNGSYPFYKTFALVYPKQKFSGALKLFVDYVFSTKACEILAENGQLCINDN